MGPEASSEAVAESLGAALSRHEGRPGRVRALRRLTGGATKRTWSFDWVCGESTRALIFQQTPGQSGPRGRVPKLDAREDATLMRVARAHGAPAPRVHLLLTEGDGKKIRLTEKEAAIIRYLFRAGQKAVTRDELLEEVWGYNSGVTTHTLETHVYRLRQKIEKDPSNAEILVTENGGYKIIP